MLAAGFLVGAIYFWESLAPESRCLSLSRCKDGILELYNRPATGHFILPYSQTLWKYRSMAIFLPRTPSHIGHTGGYDSLNVGKSTKSKLGLDQVNILKE